MNEERVDLPRPHRTDYEVAGWHQDGVVLVENDIYDCFAFNRCLVIQDQSGRFVPTGLSEADLSTSVRGELTSSDGSRRLADSDADDYEPHPIEFLDQDGRVRASFLGVIGSVTWEGEQPAVRNYKVAWDGRRAAVIAYTDADATELVILDDSGVTRTILLL